MYRIPQHVLNNLKCSICDGYLSVKPLMIRNESQQVCGKCFKLLPKDEKDKCVRQVGLEILSEVLVFPCRYNAWGCNYTFGWCDDKDHEKECPFRLRPLAMDSNSISSSKTYGTLQAQSTNVFKAQSEDLKAKFYYKVKENSEILVYNLKISGNGDKKIYIGSNSNQEGVEISMQGTVALHNTPSPIHTTLKVKNLPKDNIYESLRSIDSFKKECATCKTELKEDNSSCLLGHLSCENCKEKMCLACVKNMERQSKKFCRNYEKGCFGVFLFDEIHDHESDCNFNDFKCPIDPCNTIEMLPNLKLHLQQEHVPVENGSTRYFSSKDENFIILWKDCIFKCYYYYFRTFVEFVVTYIGSSKEASRYYYEVMVTMNGTQNKKKSKCSNWNNLMLEEGITFTRDQLVEGEHKKLAFDARIKVSQYKEQ